ncbi:hypothetical protein HaLaN_17654 [Haematococcus lacustris]|uniref:Uncharacterized protein n=1 Tax=Haematococcus lacustris TaxID=44745 RepID=A0A699ZNK7_HAELA|nr:hypothetical protein HaLaN_17654 [Haematococcus lacustris]
MALLQVPAGWEAGLPPGLQGLDEETLMELQAQLLAAQDVCLNCITFID